MIRKTLFTALLLAGIILSSPVIAQKKVFILNVHQPPSEQCLMSTPNEEVKDKVLLYPNPAHGNITIVFSANYSGSKTIIQVFSIDGKMLLSCQEYPDRTSFQKKLDLSSFSRGIYLIRISGNAIIANERVVLY